MSHSRALAMTLFGSILLGGGAATSQDTPAKDKKFKDVLKVEETTPLEPGKGYKYYAPGVGLLRDGGLKLVKHGHAKKQ